MLCKRSDAELVREALRGGLDPNTLWTKRELPVGPGPTSGYLTSMSMQEPNAWKHCNTPMHLAVLGADYKSAEIILSYGGDIDIYNGAGKTPLDEAVFYRSLDRVRFLVQHGANINRPSRTGLVPLQVALCDGAEEFFFSLLELGASLQAAGHLEWSIADLALLSSERMILARLMIEHTVFPTPMLYQASGRSRPDDFSIAARRLLAVASSNQLFPAEQLYEVYEFLLHSLNFHQGPLWDHQAVGDLIESFNAALYKASGTPRLALNEKFCTSCLEFQVSVERSCRTVESGRDSSTKAFEIHKNRAELEVCAGAGCPLCSMVAGELYKKADKAAARRELEGEAGSDLGYLRFSPITLEIRGGPFQDLTGRPRFAHLNARLARDPETDQGVVFDLQGIDTRFGKPADENSRADTTGSKHALGIAERWLEICSAKHSQCQEAYRATSRGLCSPLPTRVLHVGTPNKDPFLFESNGANASYCILSYCWGRTGNAVTTKKNLPERIKGIPLTSLPKLICEAILTARSLGFEYIWIDALCIIQDDVQDWAHEASVMHELYSRAAVTITSLMADDSRDSLFQSRPDQICRPIPLDLGLPKRDRPHHEDETVFQLSVPPERHFIAQTPVTGPIHQRAWILQEQVMSTRKLYFGAGVLHWECLHDYLLESHPSGEKDYSGFDRVVYQHRQTNLVVRGLSRPDQTRSNEQDPLKVWQTQVTEFTKRKMTKHSDRIPAFLAISKSIGAVINDEFIGGIWKGDNLLESLCWSLAQPNTTDQRGPSWTWASRSGVVDYSYLTHSGKKVRKASVVSCDASVADPSQSHVLGSITLKGTLSSFRHKGGAHRDSESLDQAGESLEVAYAFDVLEFEQGPPYDHSGVPHHVHRRPVHPNGEPAKTVRLLLRPVNEDEEFWTASLFQRIGIVSHVDDSRKMPELDPSKREYFAEHKFPPGLLDRQKLELLTTWVTVPSYWNQIVQDIQSDRVVTIV